jgi:4-alpha-glucanotransferase
MKLVRSSGILLHPTSLPGPHGVGDLGPDARRFIQFLAETRQSVWQVLPLGPTGYGDSPYQCFSAFAGNPLLVSLEDLESEGWLTADDLASPPDFPDSEADYGAVMDFKRPLLRRAHGGFVARADAAQRAAFEAYCAAHAAWLDDFALFMAIKEHHGGTAWNRWEPALATRQPEALAAWRVSAADAVEAHKFAQWVFARQWNRLREECRAHDIRVMGDLPIFVAHDSADVWAHPELFRLGLDGGPAFIAGVPPDYFSATGQCWGNPLYRWEMLHATGYQWWIERFRQAFALLDLVRLDHFRGFEAYWEIPGHEQTAVNGRWVQGPGARLFEALEQALGSSLPIVAENLGVITPEVEALRQRFGFPGMAILQFAFGTDAQARSFRPHHYERHLVAYTGTHDNDTLQGFWRTEAGVGNTNSVEELEAEKERVRAYLGLVEGDAAGAEIHWALIRTLMASVADLTIVPLQDVLGLGSEARMNLPSRPAGNWRWRFTWDVLGDLERERLRALTLACER